MMPCSSKCYGAAGRVVFKEKERVTPFLATKREKREKNLGGHYPASSRHLPIHCGAEQSRIETKVLGHSIPFICTALLLTFSALLTSLARSTALIHLFTRSLPNLWKNG